MTPVFILDACSLIALLYQEDGADVVLDLYRKAACGSIFLKMNRLNLLEVYYDTLRREGEQTARTLVSLINQSPITIIPELSDTVFFEAGRLKTSYKISLADSIALGEAFAQNGTLVTSDHHEFDVIDKNGAVKFLWIR